MLQKHFGLFFFWTHGTYVDTYTETVLSEQLCGTPFLLP